MLDPSGRSVRLTDAGEVYLRHARRALVELDAGRRAINELQDLSRGSLRLGMTPVTDYLASPLLESFSARYPGITVSTLELPQDEVEAALSEERIDVGIAFTNTLATAERSNEIDMHILFIETLNLAVGKTHPYGGQGRRSAARCWSRNRWCCSTLPSRCAAWSICIASSTASRHASRSKPPP